MTQSGFKAFNSIPRTIIYHYKLFCSILIIEVQKASVESFNAQINTFRSKFRGLRNIEFFLFRLTNLCS
ncbi:transposase [Flavobacterium petrolei]|uniref:Transposase n=1 Tax=Flavobacterium petrolei TaxID=2259594 RepID=A0A482TGM5_9FLAO|nr:transposase [Flavobacterium petrolei]RYJ51885.1 transposase [Flavobacterium petrolei]